MAYIRLFQSLAATLVFLTLSPAPVEARLASIQNGELVSTVFSADRADGFSDVFVGLTPDERVAAALVSEGPKRRKCNAGPEAGSNTLLSRFLGGAKSLFQSVVGGSATASAATVCDGQPCMGPYMSPEIWPIGCYSGCEQLECNYNTVEFSWNDGCKNCWEEGGPCHDCYNDQPCYFQ